jgi:hypothetical protein
MDFCWPTFKHITSFTGFVCQDQTWTKKTDVKVSKCVRKYHELDTQLELCKSHCVEGKGMGGEGPCDSILVIPKGKRKSGKYDCTLYLSPVTEPADYYYRSGTMFLVLQCGKEGG